MPPRTRMLCITPVAPPLGGVAMQAGMFLSSEAVTDRFEPLILRSNPLRDREDPRCSKRISPSIVAWSMLLLWRAFVAGIRHRPPVIYVTTCGDLSFIRSMAAAVAASLLRRARIVVHLHARREGICTGLGGGGPLGRTWIALCSLLSRRLALRADALIQLTGGIDMSYRAEGMPAATAVIPNCVEIAGEPDLDAKRPCSILFIGRQSGRKGFLDLLEALRHPGLQEVPWTLDVLGDPPTELAAREVEAALAGHPALDRISLHGSGTGDLKRRLLARSAILVLPSYTEIFPVSLLEGMASGMAVISTPVGEVPDIPAAGGWVAVEPGDVPGLVRALGELLSDPSRVRSMGAANSSRARSEFDLRIHAARLAELLDAGSRRGYQGRPPGAPPAQAARQ